MTIDFLKRIETIRPFTEKEAWTLFKLAAIGEAIGWSLLIFGILFKRFITPDNNIAVLIAGQIHGTIFLVYIAAVGVLYSSLRWSRKLTLVAALASIPPYGSLIFEQWAAYKRRGAALKTYREITVRAIIIHGHEILAIQPQDRAEWILPGGPVAAHETADQALQKLVKEQTSVLPSVQRLVYIWQYRNQSVERMEMFFSVYNAAEFRKLDLRKKSKDLAEIDAIDFIKPAQEENLHPTFLQNENMLAKAKRPQGNVEFIKG